MKCLVTGGAGFIGSNLVDKLITTGNEVVIIDDLSTGKESNINPKATFYQLDISTMSDYSPFEDVDVVFHTAALARVQPSIEDPITYDKVNVGGTLRVLKACVDNNVKRFVFSSSSSVYGDIDEKELPTTEMTPLNPISPYALHKLIGEQYCKLFSEIYGLETVCLRYFNVYGNRMSLEGAYKLVIPIFTEQILNDNPMTINGDGEQRRDFTYVDDVVQTNISAGTIDGEFKGDVFNIGNGDNRSVNQIADMLGGDRKHLKPVIEPKVTLADNTKARKLLNFEPSMDIESWIPIWKKDMGL
jgi:nucleoside-diphosphate-sugar epimerase